MKRFFRHAAAGEIEGGFEVRLDGKPVKTPVRKPLILPVQALADAVAREWNAVGDEIMADDMPTTKLANSVIDLMPERRSAAIAQTAEFAETDLLCYRADQPNELVQRQSLSWQPWLDWAAREYGITLQVTAGTTPIAQPEEALEAARTAVGRLNDWRLVALHSATQITGSLVLGLAVVARRLSAQEALAASLLDEIFVQEQWGEDQEQLQRHRNLARDLQGVAVFLSALEEKG